jgi:hypothetical protein
MKLLNGSRIQASFLALGALVLTLPALSLADTERASNMIEIGAGLGSMGNDAPIEALFKVELLSAIGTVNASEPMYILAQIQGSGTTDLNGLNYADFSFKTFGYRQGQGEGKSFIQLNVLESSLQRNVALNQGLMARISFLGVALNISTSNWKVPTDQVEAYVQLAGSILGIGYAERFSDSVSTRGLSPEAQLEIGAILQKKFRVSLGSRFTSVLNDHYRRYNGDFTCTPGAYPTGCLPGSYSGYATQHRSSQYYLNAVAELTETLSLFGSAQYNIYEARSDEGDFNSSNTGMFQLLMGVNVSFR